MTHPIKTDDPAKKQYRSPVLTVYGSVKEMTGGGTVGNFADTVGMVMMNA